MKLAKSYKYDKNEYKKRIKIEHIFVSLKLFKRIDQRNDKMLKYYKGFVYLAFSCLAINIINLQKIN